MEFGKISFFNDFALELSKSLNKMSHCRLEHANIIIESIFDYILTESERPDALAFYFNRSFSIYEPLVSVKERLKREQLKIPGSTVEHPKLQYIVNKMKKIRDFWDRGNKKVIPNVVYPWLRRYTGFARSNFHGLTKNKDGATLTIETAAVLEYINNKKSKDKRNGAQINYRR